jgi:hypothetical protein
LREAIGAAVYGRDVGNSLAFEGANRVVKAAYSTKQSLEGDKEWAKTAWDIGKAVEFQFGIPATKVVDQITKTYKIMNGEGPEKK